MMPNKKKWFDGVECAQCDLPLFFHEDTKGGRSSFSPATPLRIKCPNCRHEQDYDGHPHKKFRVEWE